MNLDQHQKRFMKLAQENSRRHRQHEVFRDFCEMGALSLSNRVDALHREKREARYLQIIAGYERDEIERFAEMMACIPASLEGGFKDTMGEIFMSLELGDSFKGQFFTPGSVAQLMAAMTMQDVDQVIARDGYLSLHEPAAGAGVMVIKAAEQLAAKGYMWPHRMHATLIDIDATAVHMAYMQLSWLGIPAIVVHGNSLTMKEWDHWVTPMHVVGGWDKRLKARNEARQLAQAKGQAEAAAEKQEQPEVCQPAEIGEAVAVQRAALINQIELF